MKKLLIFSSDKQYGAREVVNADPIIDLAKIQGMDINEPDTSVVIKDTLVTALQNPKYRKDPIYLRAESNAPFRFANNNLAPLSHLAGTKKSNQHIAISIATVKPDQRNIIRVITTCAKYGASCVPPDDAAPLGFMTHYGQVATENARAEYVKN
ncbi:MULTISPECIES: hypothetical protein [Shewanella]|jgi:hypothetical protein|uniref:hypothetical protein n=1 Tax=Shewanella TaxID=22 RepID=UPI00167A8FAC|nr:MULTISPECIES: hypothetical protein [Shewanella]MBO1272716.1 hypothetical protein [Shewanella sp. 4t3-1-2LB]MCL2906742.1 hypothetical protein [Shewanella fodinae]GGZ02742.1 hypothetical protein GCM10007169_19430 [Shewanella fodinae]